MSSIASLFFPNAWMKSAAQSKKEPENNQDGDISQWQQDYFNYVRHPRFIKEKGKLALDPHREHIAGWTLRGGGPMTHPKNILGRFSKRKYLKLLDKGTGWDDRARVIWPYHGTEPERFNQDYPMLRL
jgi:hypothetical protein